LSQFEKWLQRNWKEYSFTKWNKDFGQRLVGKKEGGFFSGSDIMLIYNFTQKKPTIEDFAIFLKDFEKFSDQYNDYNIAGAYFVVYEDYDKKSFNLLLKKMDDDLKDLIEIKTIDEKIVSPRSGSVVTEQLKEPERPQPRDIKTSAKRRVFIVHGRDKTPSLELARFVEKRYPIDAILLEDEAHRGRTLIEKLEDYCDVDFAFITLTPDDIGALKGESLKERGRQNVIFEWGQFIGKIGRKKVCLLIKGDVEIPSDLHGIGYYRFDKNVKECFIEVENELKDAQADLIFFS
jgi:predicted nucleotide-binding protein